MNELKRRLPYLQCEFIGFMWFTK